MELYLKNIGKIKEANIEIKGITVIGGENNTGKSTVGKSLFAIFNSFYENQQEIRQEKFLSIQNILQLLRNIYYVLSSGHVKNFDDYSAEILSKGEEYIKEPQLLKNDLHSLFGDALKKPAASFDRRDIDYAADRILNVLKIPDEMIFHSVVNKKVNAEFKGQLLNIYSDSEGIISLSIREKVLKIKVLKDSVVANGFGYGLPTEAIYIDDPFVLDDVDVRIVGGKTSYYGHREQLMHKLIKKSDNVSVVDEIVVENRFKKIYEKLLAVCDGNIVRQKNGYLGYQVKNSERLLSVDNLSTGLKTFAILKTLLTNGAIEANGTIILDEPEIHLHPEWQLLFAELIVLLNKEFAVNILLNTHSPYFLRAIQVYSAKYGMNDICKYYMSELDEKEDVYFTDVSDNVDKIFAKLAKPLQKLEDERWNID